MWKPQSTSIAQPISQGASMYWPVLAAVALAVGYYQVGAMSVWVTVLSISLKAALLTVAVGALALGVVVLRRRFA